MSKTAKHKWCCAKCKFSIDAKTKSPTVNVKKGNKASVLTNESFSNLTDSVKYMSDKFDSFGEQLQKLLKSMRHEGRKQNFKSSK
jgi:hypothetical protein